jgi:hypothetical protein
MSCNSPQVSKRTRLTKKPWIELIVVLFVACASLAWANSVFGSLRNTWLYACGMRLVTEPSGVMLGIVKGGETREATISVRNLTRSSVTILGVESSCTCLSSDKLPITIPPLSAAPLHLSMHFSESEGTHRVTQIVTYHTTQRSQPEIKVSVTADVIQQ